MTRNQIDWQNMLISGRKQSEDARHNRIFETETQRANKARENLSRLEIGVKQGTLEEAIRHNRVDEWLADFRNEEQKRHNQISEANELIKANIISSDTRRGQDVQKSLGILTNATRKLELLEKTWNDFRGTNNQKNKILKDYDIAKKNYNLALSKFGLDKEKLPYEKWEKGTQAFSNIGSGIGRITESVKDVAGLFSMFGSIR